MNRAETSKIYFDLAIDASLSDTDIWLADTDGHLVQKETGVLRTSVLSGEYVVEFRLGGTTYPIQLDQNRQYTEAQLRTGPSCPRPKVKLLHDEWNEEI